MNIKLLNSTNYPQVFELYKNDITFTPIIGSVIDQSQKGEVYQLGNSLNPAYLVEHRSGYAQIFGNFTEELQEEIKVYLLEKKFKYPLFRLYNAGYSNFVHKFSKELLATRERSKLQDLSIINSFDLSAPNLKIENINHSNFDSVNNIFAPLFRFWNDKDDFITRSRAKVAFYEDIPVSICYASAISNNIIDINIMTNKDYQQKGYAKKVVISFIRQALHDNYGVIWDCYTTNKGSMALNKSIGFVPKYEEYDFLTVEK